MQIKYKNRVATINGRRIQFGANKQLVFTVSGDTFPFARRTKPTTNGGRLQIISSVINKITINYGDGNIITYDIDRPYGNNFVIEFNDSSDVPAYAHTHTYTDGEDGLRNISISFEKPEEIYSIGQQFFNFYKSFPRNIDVLKNIERISLRESELTSFPDTMNRLDKLENLGLQNIGTAISERIPISILQTNLVSLRVTASVNLRDVYASNFFALCENLGDTLLILDIISTNILTLPPNFYKLEKLTTLNIGGRNEYTTLPPEVNEVPTLESLEVGVTSGNQRDKMVNFGSFSNLVNLNRLICRRSTTLEQFVPEDFENCVKIKTYDFGGSFQTQPRIDRFANEMYDFITTNASMAVGNTKFRQMTIVSFGVNDPSPQPIGTYQMPTGYMQGSNNGTPVSPLEKIWVLVNQYQTTWNY